MCLVHNVKKIVMGIPEGLVIFLESIASRWKMLCRNIPNFN